VLAKWKSKKEEELLKDAARFMMLGLLYTTKFADDHRGLREGRRTILRVLTPLDSDELSRFSHYVSEAEVTENIQKRPSVLQDLMRDHSLWFWD